LGISNLIEEGSMRKSFFVVTALAALVISVAAPVSAQNVSLKAVIPFEFAVGNQTLPAGEYTLKSITAPNMLQIRNESLQTGAFAMAASTVSGNSIRTGNVRLVFNQYGSHYVLSQVWDGQDAVRHDLSKSRTERELAKTASVKQVEILGTVARR
jgi:hypothetical protein